MRQAAVSTCLILAWIAPPATAAALNGTYLGDLGRVELTTDPSGRVTGRYVDGGGCQFEANRPIVDGTMEGSVLVGNVTLCQVGSACEERTYPVLAFVGHGGETIWANVKLEPGCTSPAATSGRIALRLDRSRPEAEAPAPIGGRPPSNKPSRKALEECIRSLERAQTSLKGADFASAVRYFEKGLSCNERNWGAHLGLGAAELGRGNVSKAVASFELARDLARSQRQETAEIYYDLACGYSRQNNQKGSLESLKKALDLGWSDPLTMSNDPDLQGIRSQPEFKVLVARAWEQKSARSHSRRRRKSESVEP